jgi:hypothetical protein
MATTTTTTPAPTTATEIVNLVATSGVRALARALGCSLYQAETLGLLARRAAAQGRELDPREIPRGSVGRGEASRAAVPAAAPAPPEERPSEPERLAYLRARSLAGLTSEQAAEMVNLERRQSVYRHNVAAGHYEWRPLLLLAKGE